MLSAGIGFFKSARKASNLQLTEPIATLPNAGQEGDPVPASGFSEIQG